MILAFDKLLTVVKIHVCTHFCQTGYELTTKLSDDAENNTTVAFAVSKIHAQIKKIWNKASSCGPVGLDKCHRKLFIMAHICSMRDRALVLHFRYYYLLSCKRF